MTKKITIKSITLIALFALGLGFISCGNSSKNESTGFTVNLELTSAVGKTIILDKLTPSKAEPVDTIVVGEDGKVVFNGTTSNKELYLVHTDDNKLYVYLAIDSVDNITIKGDYETFIDDYSIEGSSASLLIKEVNDHNAIANKKMYEINNSINAEQDPVKRDSIIAIARVEFTKVLEEEKAFIANFIDANPGSLAAFIALYQRILDQSIFDLNADVSVFDFYKKVADGMKQTNPNSEFTKMLIANNLQMESQLEASRQANVTTSIGADAPDVEAPGLDGKMYKLSDLKGGYVLLDFWAAWCRPCRAENPNVLSNYNKYKEKGFTVFQVSLDGTKQNWENAINKDGLGAWIHVSDLQEWDSEDARTYNVSSIPTNFLIDPEGKIIAKNLRGPALGAKLSELLD